MPKPWRALFFLWLAGFCLADVTDCRPAQEESPVNAYNSFSEAVRKGEFKTAYGYLSAGTRQAVEQRTQAVTAASGGVVKSDPATWVFANVGRAPPLTEVKLLGLDGGTATVRATGGSLATTIPMVREGAGWKVDLSQSLERRTQ